MRLWRACISCPMIRPTRSRARRCGSICPISPPSAHGLGEDARGFGCPLLGGDTVSTPGPLTVSITAFGRVPAGQMVPRTGARPGDRVLVTGTIGDAALGLE